ncbi:MAG TPA: hypothetical protein VLD85_13520 [Anaeromyxobacteraceae bacterium]|nr:hypothetical protein [Anaeromyxobacteraceae bacterium]
MTALALALALAAGPPESVSSLVDRVVQAYGGRRALAGFGARVEEGETTSLLHPGQRGRVRRVVTPGGSLRVEIRFPDGEEEVRVLHRGRGTRNGVDVTGSPPHAAMVLQAVRLDLPLLLQRGRRRIVDRGMQEREGRPLRVLELPLAGGLVVEADVDPSSGRILRSAGSMEQGPRFATGYSDFRKVKGILVPFREENWAQETRTGDTVLQKVEILAEPPPGSFETGTRL